MLSHTIVFVILSILSATAVYAASAPVGKPCPEQYTLRTGDKESTNSL